MSGRRRIGGTLVEVSIAAGLIALVSGVVVAVALQASRAFLGSEARLRGPEAAAILLEALELDLRAALQAPGDPRPPLRVLREPDPEDPDAWGPPAMEFFVATGTRRHMDRVTAAPVRWDLARAGEGPGAGWTPRRNGVPLRGVELSRWSLELEAPDPTRGVMGWHVRFEAVVPARGAFGHDYEVRRVVRLAQPSANYRYFPRLGDILMPALIDFEAPAESAGEFRGLGPPGGAAGDRSTPTQGRP